MRNVKQFIGPMKFILKKNYIELVKIFTYLYEFSIKQLRNATGSMKYISF